MKKIIVIMVLTLLSFIACDKLNKEDYKKFSYDENISLYGAPEDNQRNWNLSCDDSYCKITYSVGTPLKIRYEKELSLNEEKKKKIIKYTTVLDQLNFQKKWIL